MKALKFVGAIILFLIIWAAAAIVLSTLYGNLGGGTALFAGLAAFPIVVRLLIVKLFRPGRKLDL